ncbi:hypothetical protein C0Q70_09082 [Pomacea canaliculata]|uniref:Uncharacterized protein n=1 Tax=Pomacea canaliculata TaxID=400727 RepID=A0A2T7P8S3_POMCA|nr:hypothetical protein C0Q70_09082 [Pomacea canaliculata]
MRHFASDSRPAGNDGPRVPSKVNPPSSGSGARPSTSTHTPSYVNPSPPEYSDSRPPAGFVIPSLTVYTGTKSPVYATPTPTSYINPRGTGLSNGSPQSGDYKPPGYPNPIPPAGYVLPTPTSYTNPRGAGLSNGNPQSGDYKPSGYPNPIPPAGYVLPTPTSYTNPRGAGLSNGNPQSGDYKPSGYPNPIPPAGYVIPTPTSYTNPRGAGLSNGNPQSGDYKPPGYPNPIPPAGFVIPTPTSYVNPSQPSYRDYKPPGYPNSYHQQGISFLPQQVMSTLHHQGTVTLTHQVTQTPYHQQGISSLTHKVMFHHHQDIPTLSQQFTPVPRRQDTTAEGHLQGMVRRVQTIGYDGPSVSGLSNSKPSPSVAGYDDYKPSEDRNPPSSEYGTQGPSGYEKQEDVYTDSEDNYESFYLTADDPNYYFILEQYGLEEGMYARGCIIESSCSTYFTCENDSNGSLLGIRLNDCGDNSSYDIAQRKCVADAYCTAGCPDASHVKPANNAYKFLNGGYVQDCPRSLYFNFQSCTCEGLDDEEHGRVLWQFHHELGLGFEEDLTVGQLVNQTRSVLRLRHGLRTVRVHTCECIYIEVRLDTTTDPTLPVLEPSSPPSLVLKP